MPYIYNIFTDEIDYYASGAAIGSPISGGIANEVLYINASGNLAQSSNLTFDGATLAIIGDITLNRVFSESHSNFIALQSSSNIVIDASPSSGEVLINPQGGQVETQNNILDSGDGSGNASIIGSLNIGNDLTMSGSVSDRGISCTWSPSFDNGTPPYLDGNFQITGNATLGSGNTNFLGLSIDEISSNTPFMEFNSFTDATKSTLLNYFAIGARPSGLGFLSGIQGVQVEQTGGGLGTIVSGGLNDDINNSQLVTLGDWQSLENNAVLQLDNATSKFSFINCTLYMDNNAIFTDGNGLLTVGNIIDNGLTASRPVISDASKKLVSGSYSGNTTIIGTTSGTLTNGHIAQFDSSGNIIDSGVSVIGSVGIARANGKTAAFALATFTVPAVDTTYLVSSNINITTSTLFSFGITCTYTDETNTSRVLNLSFSNLAGTFLQTVTQALGTGAYEGIPLHIRSKANTTIIIQSTGTFTTVTYNFEERIISV